MKTTVDGLSIHYQMRGKGPVLLFLHGWAMSAENMLPIAEQFSDTYQVIVLDLPGFGESDRPAETWAVGDYAQFVTEFLKTQDIATVYGLIGHSLGGRVAIKGLADRVLVAEKLVLIGSAGIKPRQTLQKLSYRLVAKVGKFVLHLPGLRRFSAPARQRLYDMAQSTDYLNANTMRDIFLATIREDLRPLLARINIPTLLVWGSEDDQTPLADARIFHHGIAGSQLKIVQGASHFVHTEYPKKVGRWIREFLA